MIAKLLMVSGVVAAVLAVAVLAAAKMIDDGYTTEVQMISSKDQEVVAFEKELWEEGDPVAEIYGIPAGAPIKLVFVDEARLVRPVEDPSLVLLPVDKQAGDNPLQVKTVWFIAYRAAMGLAFAAFAAFLSSFLVRRRLQA